MRKEKILNKNLILEDLILLVATIFIFGSLVLAAHVVYR